MTAKESNCQTLETYKQIIDGKVSYSRRGSDGN